MDECLSVLLLPLSRFATFASSSAPSDEANISLSASVYLSAAQHERSAKSAAAQALAEEERLFSLRRGQPPRRASSQAASRGSSAALPLGLNSITQDGGSPMVDEVPAGGSFFASYLHNVHDLSTLRAQETEQLQSLLHCHTANYLSELGRGAVLSKCDFLDLLRNPACTSYMISADGVRHFYLLPVEEGRYALTISAPPSVYAIFGGQVVPYLLGTAIRGYDISPTVAASSSAPTYFPLDARLKENHVAVRDEMQSRLNTLAAVISYLLRHDSRSAREKELVLRRLCFERPSSTKTSEQLASVLHNLIRIATCGQAPATLHGHMSTDGLRSGEKRFCCVAAALWYRGYPLYRTGSDVALEQNLVPAAISAYMDSLKEHASDQHEHRSGFASPNRVALKYMAMYSHHRYCVLRRGVRSEGYVLHASREEERHIQASSSLCVSAVTKSGWTIAVQLEATRAPFTGSPLSHIDASIQHLLIHTFETHKFISYVQKNNFSMMMAQPVALLTSAVAELWKGIKELRILRRRLGGLQTLVRDSCLFSFNAAASRAYSSQTASSTAQDRGAAADYVRNCLPEAYWARIEPLVQMSTRLVSRSSRRQQARRMETGQCAPMSPMLHTQSMFSCLNGKQAVIVFHATPCSLVNGSGEDDGVVFLVAEIDRRRIPNPNTQELIALSTWLLSKTL